MNKSDITTPLVNLLNNQKYSQFMFDQTLEFLKLRPRLKSSLEWHKEKFGMQNYCINFPFKRCWVWEGTNWRVYVSKRGTSFEVLETLTPEQAMDAWHEYYAKIKCEERDL